MPEVNSERTFIIDEKNVAQKTGDRNILVLYKTAAAVAIILALVCIGDFGHLFISTGDTSLGGHFWLVRGVELGLFVVLIALVIRILIRLLRRRK
jgi:nitrogen fixation/metabolism regulation signal transduction histidine kinase